MSGRRRRAAGGGCESVHAAPMAGSKHQLRSPPHRRQMGRRLRGARRPARKLAGLDGGRMRVPLLVPHLPAHAVLGLSIQHHGGGARGGALAAQVAVPVVAGLLCGDALQTKQGTEQTMRCEARGPRLHAVGAEQRYTRAAWRDGATERRSAAPTTQLTRPPSTQARLQPAPAPSSAHHVRSLPAPPCCQPRPQGAAAAPPSGPGAAGRPFPAPAGTGGGGGCSSALGGARRLQQQQRPRGSRGAPIRWGLGTASHS